MFGDEMEAARVRMVNSFGEFARALADVVNIAMREAAEAMKRIDWPALARLKEADPDLFNWTASGPIRRVQLRRARALIKRKRRI